MSDEVACGQHGRGSATYVCQHIAGGTARRWYSAEPTAEAPWPDAWCERCDEVAERCGGWNDESEAFAGIRVLCSGCYLVRRLLLDDGEETALPFSFRYRCDACEKIHDGLPDYAFDAPAPWHGATDEERAAGSLDEDLCLVGGHRFVRGTLDLPILGTRQRMSWGVWTSLSERSFDVVFDHWDDPDRVLLPPMFGWVMNTLPRELYPETQGLKSHVYQRADRRRPLIVVEPTDHPLAIDQRRGLSPERAEDLAVTLLATIGGARA